MGRQHLKEMQAAGMSPVAVAEVDASRLAVAKTEFPGIETYSSVSAMLKGSAVDVIVIITPHNTHAKLAIECLKAGRHVVCEKPLAITTAEVDAMIRAAKSSGAMLSTYHNRHWDGRIRQAVDLVKKRKVIGDVFRIECHMGGYSQPGDWWRTSRTIAGGVLYDWGGQLLEYSLQLIDAPIGEVSGFAHEGFWAPKTKWKDDKDEDEGFLAYWKGPARHHRRVVQAPDPYPRHRRPQCKIRKGPSGEIQVEPRHRVRRRRGSPRTNLRARNEAPSL